MKRILLATCLLAQPALAEPMFEDRSAGLPKHVYDGDWTHFVGGGLAVFDCDDDGLADVFAAGGSNPATLLRNDGDFHFSKVAVPSLTGVTGAYPIDIDGDSIKDLFILRVGENVALKGGANCTFTDATAQWNIQTRDDWSTAFSAWWETNEAMPTLAIGNYVDRADPDGPFKACDNNTLLRPTRFGYAAQKLSPGFCPLSILAAKDARGRHTLRISNDRHYYVSGGYEQMWDISEQRFLGPEDGWETVSLWGMGIASRDVTGDGRDEVMLTSMGDQLLQIAQADGTYAAAPFDSGTYVQRPHVGDDTNPSTGWHAEFGDVDNDGMADLFIAKGNVDEMPDMALLDPNNLLMQQADGRFIEASDTAGVASTNRSRGAALADFDQDGRLDLIVSNRGASLELYRNISQQTGHWLALELRQTGANVDAIGALITVETAEKTQTIQHTIGGGHTGGQLLARHFGLGKADEAKVTITWPDGTVSSTYAKADQKLVVDKP